MAVPLQIAHRPFYEGGVRGPRLTGERGTAAGRLRGHAVRPEDPAEGQVLSSRDPKRQCSETSHFLQEQHYHCWPGAASLSCRSGEGPEIEFLYL